MGSNESHFNALLTIVRDKVTRQCPQTSAFEEWVEPKRNRTDVFLYVYLTDTPCTCWKWLILSLMGVFWAEGGKGVGGLYIKSEFCGPRMFVLCLQKQISFLKRYAKYIKYMKVYFGTTLVNGKPLPGRKPITTCKTGSGVVGYEATHANKTHAQRKRYVNIINIIVSRYAQMLSTLARCLLTVPTEHTHSIPRRTLVIYAVQYNQLVLWP